MNILKVIVGVSIVGLMVGMPLSAKAADEQQKTPLLQKSDALSKKPDTTVGSGEATTQKPALAGGPPVYKPPKGLGAPGGRVGGGTRGSDQTFILSVLAPNHTGLTLQDQPVLYWYLTKAISSPMEFTLTDDGVRPLIEARLNPPFQPGVQKVQLADYKAHLVPGKPYRWFVALVIEPGRRSRDILAGGAIERVESLPGLSSKLAQANKVDAWRVFAEAGLWYDAVAAISDLIDAAPSDTALRTQRAALLEQVGLRDVARFDLNPRAAN